MPGTLTHGKSTKVFLNTSELTGYLHEVSAGRTADTAEGSTFGDTYKRYALGLTDSQAQLSGRWDGTAAALDEVLNSLQGEDDHFPLIICPQGSALGNRCIAGGVIQTGYDITESIGDICGTTSSYQAGIDGIRGAKVLNDPATAWTATGNGTSVDDTAGSTAGYSAYLVITNNAHNNTVDVKVQHSTNNSTWADLATFTQVAATTVAAERLQATGTVNRYLRVVRTLAGTGDVNAIVAFSRF